MAFFNAFVILFVAVVVADFSHNAAEGRDQCFRQVSDVVIVIDSSFSIRKEAFQGQLAFLKALIDSFTIGQNHMQVGVVSFGSKVRREIRLNQLHTKTELKKAVGKITHMNSGTYTNEAIRFVHSQMFNEENGARPWAKKKMVLITDGLASDQNKTLLEARIARKKGVEIFCIGVGDQTNDAELREMASKPKSGHMFRVKNYNALGHITAALTDAACEKPLNDEAQRIPISGQYFTGGKQNIADIFFLLDSSNSIWEPDFKRYINFIRQVTSTLRLGQDAVRVGLIVYSDKPRNVFALSETQSHSYFNRVLEHVQFISGGSNTANAIKYVREHGFTKYDQRPKCTKIMVIMTDGKSSDKAATEQQAKIAHEEGIRIFAIGVGKNTDAQELMAIASDPDDKFVLHVDGFSRLPSIKDLLLVKTNDAVNEAMINDAPAETKKCPTQPTDVVFIYDTTSLSRRHHNVVINSISDVIESDAFVSTNLRFGVIREASSTRKLHDIKLTENWKKGDFKTKLDPGSKSSSAGKLLRKARKVWDDNWSQKRTIVLFLDASLKNIIGASLEASILKHSGVRIIIIGLGHFQKNYALFLASFPIKENFIIHQSKHHDDHGGELAADLIDRLCD